MYKVLAILLVGLQSIHNLYAFADISFVVIDLKYSKEKGVKICEMQPGSFSRFSGIDNVNGTSVVSKLYTDLLTEYGRPVYFTHPLYKNMKEAFVTRGGKAAHSAESLGAKLKKEPPKDPDNLFDYECFLFSLKIPPILEGQPTLFPQILFLDRAILPYCQSKLHMNTLFDSVPEAKTLRPKWNIYPKGTSKKLISAIMSDIPGDRIVIKPLESTMGRGVIILDKKDLLSTLTYIFTAGKKVLLADLERSYSQYAIDPSKYFLVEEFIESDPILLGDNPLPYDCTMRVMAVLSHHQQTTKITFLGEYWYSPKYPLDEAYTLIQSHKAKGTYFSKVDPEVMDDVKSRLTPALLAVYQKMLID